MTSIAPALALVLTALAGVAAHPATALEREDDERRTLRAANSRGQNPAVLALLEAAERELGAGQPEQASALLERALRIEPRNPTVWHYLGLASLELGNTAQADAMAAKSRSLVAGDRGLRDWASRTLIEPARSAIDTWREPPKSAQQPRRWPPSEAAAQPRRSVQPPTGRELRDAYTERVRRDRAARRAEMRSQSIIIVDGRQYRRYGSNEPARRQR
jgi:tetratricopeptide (TPR) repeat protein